MNNLKELREQLGLQQKEFCEPLGVKQTTYSNYELGITEPKIGFWITVAEKYKVSTDYLLGQTSNQHGTKYSGRSILDEKYDCLDEHGKRVVDAVIGFELDRMAEEEPEIVTIRHYLYSPAAGVNGLVSGEDYEDIPLPADAPAGADYCLTVSGDSMEPYIHDGQLVYVKEDEELHDFDVGVFFVDGSTYVKQFCRMYNGQIGLLSANSDREDANIYIRSDSTSSLVCLGKVIMKRPPAPQYR